MNIQNKIFHYALKAFLFFSVIFYIPIHGPVNPEQGAWLAYQYQELFVRYGFLFLITITFFMIRKREMKEYFVPMILIISLLSNLVTGFGIEARRSLLNIFIALFFYKAIVEYLDTEKLKEIAFWILGLLLLNAFWMVLQYFGKDPLFARPDGINNVEIYEKLIGFTKLKVNIGILGALASPILAFISPWLLLIAIPFIYISQSSCAAIAWLFSSLFILYFRCKKWIFLGVCTLLISGVLAYVFLHDMPSGQFIERFRIWKECLGAVLKSNPILGLGIGFFSKWQPTTMQANNQPIGWSWAHNEYLQWFFETGFVGLVPLFLFLRSKVVSFLKFFKDDKLQILFACFLSVALISTLHFPFHVGKFSGICVFLIAAYQARVEELEWRL